VHLYLSWCGMLRIDLSDCSRKQLQGPTLNLSEGDLVVESFYRK